MAAEEEDERRGGSVMMIVGVSLVVLTLIGLVGILCLAGGVMMGVGTVMLRPAPQPMPVVQGGTSGSSGGNGGTNPVFTPSTPPPPAAPANPTPADIASLEPDRWHVITSEPPSPLPAFDGLGSIDWAIGIAREWQPDAELHRAMFSGIKLDGSIDLVADDDADADYRFYSPRLTELAKKAEEVSEDTVWSGFRVMIDDGEVSVMITDSTFTAPPMKGDRIDPEHKTFKGVAKTCKAADIIRKTRADSRYPKRPKYEFDVRAWPRRPYVINVEPGGFIDPLTCEPTNR